MSLAPLTWLPLRRRAHDIIARCHALMETVRHPYRPELYYMRGPGPKWRAKNNGAIAQQ